MPTCGHCAGRRPCRTICAIHLLIVFLLLIAPATEAFAQPETLSASEIRERIVGNSLAFQHKGQVLGRRYLAEDGTTVFDPLRGFPVPGYWVIEEESDRLCMRDVDLEKPYCARFVVGDGRYFLDWGDGIDRDSAEIVEQGDTTDLSDNPGPDYKPDPGIPLPADLTIQPPASDTQDQVTALVGAWFGTIYVSRDYLIVVEKIEGAHADVVYAWSSNHFSPDTAGWSRHKADIGDGTLEIELKWGTISGRLEEDGTLTATFDWGKGAAWTRAVRWDDPSLASRPPLEVRAPDPDRARDNLAFWDLQMSRSLGEDPLHNDYFMPLGGAGPAHHSFEGTLVVGNSKVLGRPAGSRGAHDYGAFPAFSMDFFTHGDRLIPGERDILRTSRDSGRWNIILEPGRIWSEPGDNGWSRASFPFLLVPPLTGDGHNGLATFLFNESEISTLRFQVVKEASPYNHLDLWGMAELRYEPGLIDRRNELMSAFEQELADRVELHSWAEAEARFGADVVAPFDGTAIRPEISDSALIVDGDVYATGCRTRYGPYPYCREMRHGVYSVTKSLAGLLSLLRLAEKYGEEVFDLKIADYVDIAAAHDGWKGVTFEHAVSMVTGIGDVEPTRVSHYVEATSGSFWKAPSAQEKLTKVSALGDYPWGPGEVFRYISSGSFVLGAAMDALLKSKEGPDVHLWQMMNREIFQPIGIPWLPTQHTIEDRGHPGLPTVGIGIYVTLDDVVKIERLIRNRGRHDGQQLLHAEKLRESLEQGHRLGYSTGWSNDQGDVSYFRSFWITLQESRAGCIAPVPGMSGSGGNYVLLMPNGVTAVRFAGGNDDDEESGTFDSSHMLKVADDIRPLCDP